MPVFVGELKFRYVCSAPCFLTLMDLEASFLAPISQLSISTLLLFRDLLFLLPLGEAPLENACTVNGDW